VPTTSLGLRYPTGGDVPNVAQYIQNLASDVNTVLDTAPVGVTMAGGWTVIGTVQCVKVTPNFVQCMGRVSNNSSYNPTSAAALVFTLPVGYRPAAIRTCVVGLFPAAPTTLLASVATNGQVTVAHSGNVTIPVTQSHYFDTLSFYID
jgi:hypothetical protein